MLPLAEAQRRLLALATPLPRERVALEEALGRVLAEEVRAPADVPRLSASTMDGYALAAASLIGDGPWTLPVVGESRAGQPAPTVAAGTTCRIFTGAALPAGADAVVPQERVRRAGDQAVFEERPRQGAFIRRRGEDLTAGAVALGPGVRLGPAQLGLLAMLDRAVVEVARRPVVTVVSTGDELREPGQAGPPESVPDSAGVAVRSLARAAGAITRAAPFARDDDQGTTRALTDGLRGTDVLVTIGGVSVGDHDRVRPALEAAGVTLDFWRIALKPGKPLAVGTAGNAIVLGLPGNPTSAVVTFALFGLPLLRALEGRAPALPRPVRARLGAPVRHETGRLELTRGTLAVVDGALEAMVLPQQASGALTSLAAADALIALPADVELLPAGAEVEVYPWPELVA